MPSFFHNGGMAKKKKLHTEFRKNRSSRTRQSDVTRESSRWRRTQAGCSARKRISGKGELSRKRVVVGESASESGGFGVVPEVDLAVCRRGRVVAVYGLSSDIETDDGAMYQCATRRLLKTLATDQRHVVAAGDWVYFRPAERPERESSSASSRARPC